MITYEKMSDVMHKLHLGDGTVLHTFLGPDMGDPHDHPWAFTSTVLVGGYTEEIFNPRTGVSHEVRRAVGDTFVVSATRVHRIIALTDGVCVTRIRPSVGVQKPGFWRWIEGVAERRDWDGDWEQPVSYRGIIRIGMVFRHNHHNAAVSRVRTIDDVFQIKFDGRWYDEDEFRRIVS